MYGKHTPCACMQAITPSIHTIHPQHPLKQTPPHPHQQSLRELLATYNGIEISTRGDSFTVVFFSASAAIKWAVAVQHRLLHTSWPKRVYALPSCGRVYTPDGVVSFAGPRVRMGIHWAEGGSFTCTYVWLCGGWACEGMGWVMVGGWGGGCLRAFPLCCALLLF